MTHIWSKLSESHGNQMRELLRYLDTKGRGSLGQVQSFKMWILENQKRGLLGKGWCLMGRDSGDGKHMSGESIVSNLGDSCETKREDP